MTRIMVADDSVYMRKIIKKVLGDLGYTDIVEAETGKQTLETFQRDKPDLVLLDIIFPDIGGEESLRKMLTINPSAKVIMVTSVGQESVRDSCMKTGAKDFITKPFDAADIGESIKKVLR